MTLREIEQFVLESWLVLFVVDNFRLHRFFHKKHDEKVDFFVCLCYLYEFLKKGNRFSSVLEFLAVCCGLLMYGYGMKWHAKVHVVETRKNY